MAGLYQMGILDVRQRGPDDACGPAAPLADAAA